MLQGPAQDFLIRAEIEILPSTGKDLASNQPDFRVLTKGYEIGAGWLRTAEAYAKSTKVRLAEPDGT
jgi:uncharacterized protein (DUF736 family)